MLKFFRKIRQQLLSESKPATPAGRFSKYLLYAIGEIVLVVIGILIALQINTWNSERLNKYKEKDYLSEIKENLKFDKLNTLKVLEFNNLKVKAIDSIFVIFEHAETNESYMSDFLSIGNPLTGFQTFQPTRTTFENLLASDQIDIISSKKLRNAIVAYYSKTNKIETQEIIKQNTRNYVRNILPKIIDHKEVQELMNFNIDFQDDESLEIYKDRSVVASIRLMKANILVQNSYIKECGAQIDTLNRLIELEFK